MGEKFGWRAKIGLISPAGDWCNAPEYAGILPEGIALDVTTLGVARVVAEDLEKVFDKYLPAAKHLEGQECDVIIVAGSAVFSHVGYQRSLELLDQIKKSVKVPVVMNLESQFQALRTVGAKKIVLVTPYEDARNEERRKLCEKLGFKVVAMKGLGIARRIEIEKLPQYASYRLARQAVAEAPEADTIYISCPEWPTVKIVDRLERDTGKPVIAPALVDVWISLKTLGIHETIKGYGKLLETLA